MSRTFKKAFPIPMPSATPTGKVCIQKDTLQFLWESIPPEMDDLCIKLKIKSLCSIDIVVFKSLSHAAI